MNLKRFGHILVCLVLICSLLIGISPIRSQAIVITATTATVVGTYVMSGIIGTGAALGVLEHMENLYEQGTFDPLISSLTEAGHIVNDLFQVYVVDGLTYVSSEVVMAVRDFLYDSEVLSVPYGFYEAGSPYTLLNGEVLTCPTDFITFRALYNTNKVEEMVLPLSGSIVYDADGDDVATSSVIIDGVRYSFYAVGYSGAISNYFPLCPIDLGSIAGVDVCRTLIMNYLSGVYGVTAAEGVLLGERVATPEIPVEELHEVTWTTPWIWEYDFGIDGDGTGNGDGDGNNDGNDDGNKKLLAPVTFPSEFGTLTQDEAQSGQTDLDSMIEGDLGGNSGGNSGSNTGSDSGSVSGGDDYLSQKVNSLRTRFIFADSILGTVDYLSQKLANLGQEPPVVYVDLGAADGSYDFGDKVVFMDLSWYEKYKPTGDAIISTFLWWFFVWRLFVTLPGIINGLPANWTHSTSDSTGKTKQSSSNQSARRKK